MRKVLFLTTVLAFIFTSSVWAADVSGTWTVNMKNPMGQDDSFDIDIKAAGEKLTITGTHPQLQALEGTGTLKGDAIAMDITAASMGIKFVFNGKVAADKMSGTREIDMSGMSAGGRGGQAPAGGEGGAPGGQAPAGGEGGAPGGQAPAGGQGGASGGQAPAGEQGGAPGGAGGAPGGAQGEVSDAWTAVKK